MQELSKTRGQSIDKYLNVNKKFEEIGINAIIAQIYQSEVKSHLPYDRRYKISEDDWYTYLYKKLVEGLNRREDFFRINENRISFITFNYDRSLEHYLFENLFGFLKNADVDRKDLAELFLKIPFIHVYGKIGYLPWQRGFSDELDSKDRHLIESGAILPYGLPGVFPYEPGSKIRDQISIMYDKRKDNEEILRAQNLIANANVVMFLGFGYDDQNLKILNMPEILKEKSVYGTAYNATENERDRIKAKLGGGKRIHIYPYDCKMLLRNHLS